MTTWVIVSWVFVALFTALNVVLFLKLKKASEQMMKMAFPNAKNMGDAMAQAQAMMSKLGGAGNTFPGGRPNLNMNDPNVKRAMEMLKNMQGGPKK
jgi:hypothetical protein